MAAVVGHSHSIIESFDPRSPGSVAWFLSARATAMASMSASSKVVFRLTDPENLEPLAKWLYMGVMNPDEVKHELYSTKVMSYREEYRTAYGRSESAGESTGHSTGKATGAGRGGTIVYPFEGPEWSSFSESEHSFASRSESSSEGLSRTRGHSESEFPVLIPEFGKELSHVQFRSLEEQLFRAMAALFDQKERQCVARLVGMRAPVSLYTPAVESFPKDDKVLRNYIRKLVKKLPYVLPAMEAKKRINDRQKSFVEDMQGQAADEPTSAKRALK